MLSEEAKVGSQNLNSPPSSQQIQSKIKALSHKNKYKQLNDQQTEFMQENMAN